MREVSGSAFTKYKNNLFFHSFPRIKGTSNKIEMHFNRVILVHLQ